MELSNAALPPPLRYASGLYYGPVGTLGTNVPVNQQVRATRFEVYEATLFDRIGLEVTGAGAAGSTIALGIYRDDGGIPGSLLLNAGTVLGDSATYQELTIAALLTPGPWWLAALAVSGGTVPTVRAITTAANQNSGRSNATGAASGLAHNGVTSFPASFVVAGGTVGPFIELRAA